MTSFHVGWGVQKEGGTNFGRWYIVKLCPYSHKRVKVLPPFLHRFSLPRKVFIANPSYVRAFHYSTHSQTSFFFEAAEKIFSPFYVNESNSSSFTIRYASLAPSYTLTSVFVYISELSYQTAYFERRLLRNCGGF